MTETLAEGLPWVLGAILLALLWELCGTAFHRLWAWWRGSL